MRAAGFGGSARGFRLALCLFLCLGGAIFAGAPAGAQGAPEGESPAGAPAAAPALSDQAPREVAVGLYLNAPFAMRAGEDGYRGMAVELWEKVAASTGLLPQYRVYPTVRALVDAAASGEIDVAVTSLSITEPRARRIDFTYPWFDGGLRIMVDSRNGAGFWEVLRGLRDFGFLRSYLWLAFVILLASVLFTLFYRRFDKNFPTRWRDGFAEGFYAVMSIATSGRASISKNYFGWLGRIWAALWLVCGVAVVAYLTSSVTSVMTTISLNNQIDSLADLPGRRVGVSEGTVAEDYVRQNGIEFVPFDNLEDAVSALLARDIDAIVDDAPDLEYYVHNHADQPLEVIGAIFQRDKYGFGVANQSGLTRPISVELIAAQDRGEIADLKEKYFGN
ncbi:transporter substrate-binding domain-containing protein [Afifella sp. IM 167]|uniref:transporter substrate-binding domain-containing protein n=1 Tax=Afifella sp. IM 167 TaxID=2033586 RepID=UPI001CCE277C|nr:transporter substrate-binding domain-containing protein [Afifella sp. IM 167]MBZ8135186.1 ABC transporter substrate-binding protein [Afifella sp. IM 167]